MDRQLGYLVAPVSRVDGLRLVSADGLEANDAGMRRRTYAVLNRITTKRSRPAGALPDYHPLRHSNKLQSAGP
jgi:hypothetical protein